MMVKGLHSLMLKFRHKTSIPPTVIDGAHNSVDSNAAPLSIFYGNVIEIPGESTVNYCPAQSPINDNEETIGEKSSSDYNSISQPLVTSGHVEDTLHNSHVKKKLFTGSLKRKKIRAEDSQSAVELRNENGHYRRKRLHSVGSQCSDRFNVDDIKFCDDQIIGLESTVLQTTIDESTDYFSDLNQTKKLGKSSKYGRFSLSNISRRYSSVQSIQRFLSPSRMFKSPSKSAPSRSDVGSVPIGRNSQPALPCHSSEPQHGLTNLRLLLSNESAHGAIPLCTGTELGGSNAPANSELHKDRAFGSNKLPDDCVDILRKDSIGIIGHNVAVQDSLMLEETVLPHVPTISSDADNVSMLFNDGDDVIKGAVVGELSTAHSASDAVLKECDNNCVPIKIHDGRDSPRRECLSELLNVVTIIFTKY